MPRVRLARPFQLRLSLNSFSLPYAFEAVADWTIPELLLCSKILPEFRSGAGKPRRSMIAEVSTYIRRHTTVIAPLYKDYSYKLWDLSLDGNDKNLEKAAADAKERYLKVYNNREEFGLIREWTKQAASMDQIEARQLKLIHDAFVPNQIEPDVLHDIVERETQIENIFNTFRAQLEGVKVSDNDIREILSTESNISRRRAAWEASRQAGHEVAPLL